MAKVQPEETAEKILQTYAFPELGISVEAESLSLAQSMASKHPDIIYPAE